MKLVFHSPMHVHSHGVHDGYYRIIIQDEDSNEIVLVFQEREEYQEFLKEFVPVIKIGLGRFK